MAGLDLSGFDVPENKFEGLYQAANSLQRRNIINQRFALQEQGRQAATSKFVTDYLDPKDHLTGTAYDPQIVSGLQSVLQQAQGLIQKGAATQDVMMAIGPQVAKLNEYSTKAKLINDQIKSSIGKLKGYAGYNPEALETEAKRQAFYGPDGKLKDISTVDPTQDWVTEAVKENPEAVTTGKGLDDFVAKTPMAETIQNLTTSYEGRSQIHNYKVEAPFYMGVKYDANKNPTGVGVMSSPIVGDDGKPMVNPETGQPYQAMDKHAFGAIMTRNPDIADYIRGEVNRHFKAAGAKDLPLEGSPQWSAMARSVLGEELETRNKSHFNRVDQQKESAQAIKIDIAQNPNDLDAIARFNAAQKDKGQYAIYDPKGGKAIKTNAVEAIGKIFNNNPAFLQGESTDLPDGRTVINVTPALPGGGLKSGRGEDYNYKNIYYDPNKRSLILDVEDKRKLPDGTKPVTQEEIPEAKAGQFMTRIAAANGVDPDKVGDIFTQVGYRGAKFTNPGNLPEIGARVNQEHAARQATVDKAIEGDNFDSLKGHTTKDGEITNVSERTLTSWIPGRDKYGVTVKTPDGKTKTVTFNDKKGMADYIKGSQEKPVSAEDVKNKYGIIY